MIVLLGGGAARAADAVEVLSGEVDPPTVITLGVRVLVAGDDDRDARAEVRYRAVGEGAYREGPPLHRVRPSVVVGLPVEDQFAGSLFHLAPGTEYEIEVSILDPDGGDTKVDLEATTRKVPPLMPAAPNVITVSSASELQSALDGAAPGDVIELQEGTYAGNFSISASGTAEDPIVIRGASQGGVILDGQGCEPCNVLEVYGSFVHVERLTIAHASRALRFQGAGAEGNVVRRVKLEDVILGIGAKADQKDFYICDNELTGRLSWPSVYTDDGGQHANDDGINVQGTGHVVCHNRLYGFGDAIKTEQDGAVSIDFYGNEILSAYDNGVELDGSARNVRCFGNRFTNTYATISFQPIFGGPAYAIRNVAVNVAHEQLKVHALGTDPPQEPSGMYVLHNTFVSPRLALSDQTSHAAHDFVIRNNLFVGPAVTESGRTVDWTSPIDNGLFDHNGYHPDGEFAFNHAGSGYVVASSFAELQAAGIEEGGVLVPAATFESGLVPPADYTATVDPADATLAAGSPAVDAALPLPGINDGFEGSGPDMGALERGCDAPLFGVRPEGVDESNAQTVCGSGQGGSGAGGSGAGAGGGTSAGGGDAGGAGGGGGGGGGGENGGGCGCSAAGADGSTAWAVMVGGLLLLAGAGRRRRTVVPPQDSDVRSYSL